MIEPYKYPRGELVERVRAGESLKLYEHGGGRELSTTQRDHYKEPVARAVALSPAGEGVVPKNDYEELWDVARELAEALRESRDGYTEGLTNWAAVASRGKQALARFDALQEGTDG